LVLAWGRFGEIFDIVVRPTYFLDLDSFHLVWILPWGRKKTQYLERCESIGIIEYLNNFLKMLHSGEFGTCLHLSKGSVQWKLDASLVRPFHIRCL
jgi:hypothetical protein